jgi:cytochrome c oxidase subunit I+III
MIGAGVLIIVIDIIRNFRFSTDESAGNIYEAGTLEWLPTGLYSSRSIPVVRSRYPLWDDPDLARDVEAGRYFLPNSATGERETIVTSPWRAEPQYLQRMPGPSWFHLGAAIFTAGFFLLLTVKLYWIAIASGLLAVGCMLRWAWANDMPMKQASADIGAGIIVPTYASGPKSHGWWATSTLLTVMGMIFLMLVFSYVFLWSRQPEIWPEARPVATFWICAAFWAGAFMSAVAAPLLCRRSPMLAALLAFLSAVAAIGALSIDGLDWIASGLDPAFHAHGALVAMFLTWQGVFVAVAALMALYVLARLLSGLLGRERPATIESVALFLAYTAGQGLIAIAVTRLFAMAV